jgi:hypothetical protein
LAAGLACLFPILAGCGAESEPREAVSGQVTLNGQPLEQGSILFRPLDRGPSASGEIKAGSYQLPKERGPGRGKCRVEILAYRDTGKTVRDQLSGKTEAVLKPIIPPCYNQQSTLSVEVGKDGKNQFDFKLLAR